MNMDSFKDIIDALPDSKGKNYADKVTSLIATVVGVGVLSLVVGLILIIPFSVTSYVMGLRIMLDTLGLCGSIVISVVGLFVAVLSVYFFVRVPATRMYSGLLVGILILGIFLIFLGILGATGYLLEREHKWPIRIFAVLLCAMLISFFVIALLAVRASGGASIRQVVEKGIASFCELDDGVEGSQKDSVAITKSDCFPIVQNIISYLCNGQESGVLDPCPEQLKEDGQCSCNDSLGDKVSQLTKDQFLDAIITYTSSVLAGNYKVVILIAFVVVIFLVVMLISVFASCCLYRRDLGPGAAAMGTRMGGEAGVGVGGGGGLAGQVEVDDPVVTSGPLNVNAEAADVAAGQYVRDGTRP